MVRRLHEHQRNAGSKPCKPKSCFSLPLPREETAKRAVRQRPILCRLPCSKIRLLLKLLSSATTSPTLLYCAVGTCLRCVTAELVAGDTSTLPCIVLTYISYFRSSGIGSYNIDSRT